MGMFDILVNPQKSLKVLINNVSNFRSTITVCDKCLLKTLKPINLHKR